MWIPDISTIGLSPTVPPLFRSVFLDMLYHAEPEGGAAAGERPVAYLIRRMRDFAPLFPPVSPVHHQSSDRLCFSPAGRIAAPTFNDPVGVLMGRSADILQANRQLLALLDLIRRPNSAPRPSPPPFGPVPAAADVTALAAGIDALAGEIQALLGSHNVRDVVRVHGLLVEVQRLTAVLARAIELRTATVARRALEAV